MAEFNPNMLEHYNARGEARRLNDFKLEKVRTQLILDRVLPAPPARVLDVGGAHGIYAFPLAERGYEVILIDPVQVHIDQASETNRLSKTPLRGIEQGDARALRFPENSADVILYMGPLYHLLERSERIMAIKSAFKVLKPG